MGAIVEVLQNPKVQTGVALATTSTGGGAWLGWLENIPDDVVKLGVLAGVAVSLTMVVANVMALRISALKLEIMERKEQERQEERRLAKLPARRSTD